MKRWWRYAVIRGDGVPAALDGRWYDFNLLEQQMPYVGPGATLEPTNRWEQRESDGAVAVVYEWTRRPAEAHCSRHRHYDPTCSPCVYAEMDRLGVKPCHHTVEEGCTGHGDF